MMISARLGYLIHKAMDATDLEQKQDCMPFKTYRTIYTENGIMKVMARAELSEGELLQFRALIFRSAPELLPFYDKIMKARVMI